MPKLTAIRKQALDGMMREAIFEAAVTVLAEHGVDGMTMDRVAVAANMAKGSLYHYFSGKQALLELVHAKITEPIIGNLEAVVATEQPAIAKLASHLHKLLEHVASHLPVFKLIFEDDAAVGLLQSSHRRAREAGGRWLASIFRQGIAEGVFQPVDPMLLTWLFLGLCRGVFDSHPDLEGREQREKIHRIIMDAFLNGIATRSAVAADGCQRRET
jgi:AcrR family transcriptional regulator